MDGVYNRKLFAKKATDARDKLREMGGVQPMPRPQVSGIMASSPELMQAAMRKQVVLPASDRPMPMAPMPQPMAPMLPPSQPIPNIAGIPQTQPQQPQQPRPQQQQQTVKRMNEGGFIKGATELGSAIGRETPFTLGFKKSLEFAQKALTSEDAASLGLPEGAPGKIKAAGEKLAQNPEAVADKVIGEVLSDKEKTGSKKKDLAKAATKLGVTEVPAEAEIDELNRAIFGAKLAEAVAGSYVNPNTGQELRPTAGSRIASAAVEGLAVLRDTETRRAQQEADLAKAQMAAAARSKSTTTKLTGADKELMDMFAYRVGQGGEDPAKVAEDFNKDIPGSGDRILAYLQNAPLGGGGTGMTTLDKARYAISQGADRQAVIDRLVAAGIDPGDL